MEETKRMPVAYFIGSYLPRKVKKRREGEGQGREREERERGEAIKILKMIIQGNIFNE